MSDIFFNFILQLIYKEKPGEVAGCDWWSIKWNTHVGTKDVYSLCMVIPPNA